MTNDKAHHWLHYFAISEILVALVTLTFGALVTTKHAGMAFPDWPTSDGYLMVTYPWLKDFAVDWNKFLEHGHRLAGMLIGMWSIALVVLTFRSEQRKWVRALSVSILLGVICQGLLGGFRVQLNDRGLAMLHGMFAAIVFSLMGILAAVASRSWKMCRPAEAVPRLFGIVAASAVLVGLTCVQYGLGSLIRHQGTALNEHYVLGLSVLGVAIFTGLLAAGSRNSWLRRSAAVVTLMILGQVVLGLCSWGMKYGVASWGYVAVADSVPQVLMRTAHMVWGVMVLMAVVVNLIKVLRVRSLAPRAVEPVLELRRAGSGLQSGGVQ